MKKTRSLAAFLATLMLAGTMASCATSTDDPDASKSPSESTAAVEDETELTDNLPNDLNFGGEEITVISRARLG